MVEEHAYHMYPMMLNPKDFQDYDDYRAAIEEQEWREDQLDDPDGSKAKEAEMRREIWARFFQERRVPRCIPSCRKPLCLSREGCILVELRLIQDLWNEWFFEHALEEKDMLVDLDALGERRDRQERGEKVRRGLCSVLPENWQKLDAHEHQVLRFFIDVWDLISCEEKTPALSAFAQDVYRFTLSVLRGVPWGEAEKGMQRIGKVLQEGKVLSQMATVMLSGSWESIALLPLVKTSRLYGDL